MTGTSPDPSPGPARHDGRGGGGAANLFWPVAAIVTAAGATALLGTGLNRYYDDHHSSVGTPVASATVQPGTAQPPSATTQGASPAQQPATDPGTGTVTDSTSGTVGTTGPAPGTSTPVAPEGATTAAGRNAPATAAGGSRGTASPSVSRPGAEHPGTGSGPSATAPRRGAVVSRGGLERPGPDSPYTLWVVRPGDTLSSISQATGVSVDTISWFNHLSDVDMIYDGSALRIPQTEG